MSEHRELLRNRSYRRFFLARLTSSLGNGITPIALAFGILDLPGATPTSLSIVLAAQAVPLVLLLPIGGVIADRLGRARVVGITDIVLSGFIMAAAVLFITGNATVPLIAAINVVYGALAALWYPAMGGMMPDVVDDSQLQPANAAISIATNGGLVAGNAIGGALVALVGPGFAIAIDALTFFAAGVLVWSFRHVSRPSGSQESMGDDLLHGWRVFWSFRWVVVVVAAFSVIIMSWRGSNEVMGPVLAKEIYGGAAGWAAIMAAESAGLLAGAFIAARVRPSRPLVFGMLITLALPVYQVTLAFGLPIAVVAVAAFGLGIALESFFVIWQVAVQTHVPREALSRVSSYDAMGSLLLGPVGLALAGPLIASAGAQIAFLIAAALAVIPIALSLLSPAVWGLRATKPAGDFGASGRSAH